jgi:serine protease
VPKGFLGYLSLYPTGQSRPLVSTLNSWNGRTVANAAIVPAGLNGAVTVFAANETDVVLDINGYFVPPGDPNGLVFYPVGACRIADTRPGTGKSGSYGAPIMAAGTTRSFDVPNAGCGVPSSARAFALSITAQPTGSLGFLTAYPTGQDRPLASTLNSWDGQVVPNAALVSAGTNGAISVYVSNESHVVVDIAGYFAPANQTPAGNLFYPASPCRVADTRESGGILNGQTARNFPVAASGCAITTQAQSYVLNTTAVPVASLAFVTLWPSSLQRPSVSHLNSGNGQVVANMALIPGGQTGTVSAFASDPTHLVLDISGYFAP